MTKARASLFIIVLTAVIGSGQAQADKSISRVEIKGAQITSYIPHGMNVELAPYRLERSKEMSALFYRFSNTGTETIYGLRWRVYVSNSRGRIVYKDSWWDRGEWVPGSEVEEKTVFSYQNAPGSKLTIILQEIISKTGVRNINAGRDEQ